MKTGQMRKNRKPRIISLYSGAGGMDYGFEAAGFETKVAVEMNHDCCETLRRNTSWAVIERSIFDVPSAEILTAAGLRRGEADLLIGGPPCQPFSKSGYWARGDSLRLNDPRSNTLNAYLRVLEDTLPRAFVLENVEGLAFAGKDEGLILLLRRIEQINRKTKSAYNPRFQVLNAADYGVPQVRARFVLVASRDGRPFEFPAPTHAPAEKVASLRGGCLSSYRTAWDAIGNLPKPIGEDLAVRGKWSELLASIPEGKNYLWHTNRGGGLPLFGWRTRYWTFLLKLAKNRPSWTIQAQPGPSVGPFHWENRRLSTRELCRLQTFPDKVLICGGRTSIQKQLGNAVPSLLTEVLGRAIRIQYFGLPASKRPLGLLPPDYSPAPAAERIRPVVSTFRRLAGEYAAHPGTGLGNAARQRLLAAF